MRTVSNRLFGKLLENAGISVNGNNPGDLQLHNPKAISEVSKHGSLGLGETYMQGWWDCDALDVFFAKLLRYSLSDKNKISGAKRAVIRVTRALNPQRKSRAFTVGEKHYDIGNELYEAMLGESMVYTCADWSNSRNLTDAQFAKLDLVCRKLRLKPGMRVLDIGCGFGSFAKYASEIYGVHVEGVTVSKEQLEYAEKLCSGLDVKFTLCDYRDLKGKYDAIASIGMFEHVGDKNYEVYMRKTADLLEPEGLFLLHTIAKNKTSPYSDPWVTKYIFPNGFLPSLASIAPSVENHFVLEDLHNLGVNYDLTLMAWYENFIYNWGKIEHLFDDTFYRMWRYYLLSCAGSFRARNLQVWQLLLSKSGIIGGLPSVR